MMIPQLQAKPKVVWNTWHNGVRRNYRERQLETISRAGWQVPQEDAPEYKLAPKYKLRQLVRQLRRRVSLTFVAAGLVIACMPQKPDGERVIAPIGNILISILSRGLGGPGGGGGGGGGNPATLPYGAAAIPNGMQWDYTEGGTRQITGTPLSFSYAAPPTVTGTIRSANSAASWATAWASAVDGDGVQITGNFNTSTLLNVPNRSSSGGWVTVFTDLEDQLQDDVPYSADLMSSAATNRIAESDTGCYYTITLTAATSIALVGFSQSTPGVWFKGIKLTRTQNANEAIVDIGTTTITQESHLPNRIVFDRMIVDAAEHSKRAFNVHGKDILISGSLGINATSSQAGFTDSQAIAAWRACVKMLVLNCGLSAESEVIAFGGDLPAITNLQPGTDVAVIGCHIFKPSSWDSDGTWPLKKNMIENKTGRRVIYFRNVFDNFKSSTLGQHYQMMFTPEAIFVAHPWQGIFDLTVGCIYMINGTEGGPLTLSAQGSRTDPNAGGARWTFFQIYQKHGSSDIATSEIQILGDPARQHSVVDTHIEHCTWHCDSSGLIIQSELNGVGDWERFVYRNCVNVRAPDFGPIFTSTAVNAVALNTHLGTGNWTHSHNAQLSGGASWGATLLGAPHNNIQDTAANMFTNAGASDYSAKAGGPLAGTASDGFDRGADTSWVVTATAGIV